MKTSLSRYQCLLQVVEKTLTKSKSEIDTKKLLENVYEDDVKIFGEETLQTLLDSVLQGVNMSVAQEMREFFHDHKVPSKLEKIDEVIQYLNQVDDVKKRAQEQDKLTAHRALQQAKLPENMTPQDLVKIQKYQLLEKQKEELEGKIQLMEKENEQLQQQTKAKEQQVQHQKALLQKQNQLLNEAADKSSSINI